MPRINWGWLLVGVLLGFAVRHYMASRARAAS